MPRPTSWEQIPALWATALHSNLTGSTEWKAAGVRRSRTICWEHPGRAPTAWVSHPSRSCNPVTSRFPAPFPRIGNRKGTNAGAAGAAVVGNRSSVCHWATRHAWYARRVQNIVLDGAKFAPAAVVIIEKAAPSALLVALLQETKSGSPGARVLILQRPDARESHRSTQQSTRPACHAANAEPCSVPQNDQTVELGN